MSIPKRTELFELAATDSCIVISDDCKLKLSLYEGPPDVVRVPRHTVMAAAIGAYASEHMAEILEWFAAHDSKKALGWKPSILTAEETAEDNDEEVEL